MPITLGKTGTGHGSAATTGTATWTGATTAGSCLTAVIVHTTAAPGTYTSVPAGWTQVGSTSGTLGPIVSLWIKINGASESSAAWTWTTLSTDWAIVTAEFTGILTTSPTDATGTAANGTNGSPSASVTTTVVGDLVWGAIADAYATSGSSSGVFTAPTNSFLIATQIGNQSGSGVSTRGCNAGLIYRVVTTATSYTGGANDANQSSNTWRAILSSLQSQPSGPAAGSLLLLGVGV